MSEQEQPEVEGHGKKWPRNEEPAVTPEEKAEERREDEQGDVEAHGVRWKPTSGRPDK